MVEAEIDKCKKELEASFRESDSEESDSTNGRDHANSAPLKDNEEQKIPDSPEVEDTPAPADVLSNSYHSSNEKSGGKEVDKSQESDV